MATSTGTSRPWAALDPQRREALDARFLDELRSWAEPGLTDEGVRAYLEFRRQRPEAQITTFEEGRIRKLLHRYVDPSSVPDPVAFETHHDRIERYGAERLHLTHSQTYVAIMVTLTLAFLIVVGAAVIFGL